MTPFFSGFFTQLLPYHYHIFYLFYKLSLDPWHVTRVIIFFTPQKITHPTAGFLRFSTFFKRIKVKKIIFITIHGNTANPCITMTVQNLWYVTCHGNKNNNMRFSGWFLIRMLNKSYKLNVNEINNPLHKHKKGKIRGWKKNQTAITILLPFGFLFLKYRVTRPPYHFSIVQAGGKFFFT